MAPLYFLWEDKWGGQELPRKLEKNTPELVFALNSCTIDSMRLWCLVLLVSPAAWALVDYSDETTYRPQSASATSVRTRAAPPRAAKSVRSPSTSQATRLRRGPGLFQVAAGYRSVNASQVGLSGRANLIEMDALMRTPHNIFLSASYWLARTSDENLAESSKTHKGNVRLLLGLNWLRFGVPADAVDVNLIAGLSLGRKNAAFATSRTDKIVGLQTQKRFHQFSLGLTGEFHISGSPREGETAIGNVRNISATLNWQVGPDIRFSLSGGTCTISAFSRDEWRAERLEEKVSFGYFTPALNLNLSNSVVMVLAADFSGKKARQDALGRARLWRLPGLYGNSLSAKLALGI